MQGTVNFVSAVELLGSDYDSALECCWNANDWEDEVGISTFLKGWTKYIEETAIFSMNRADSDR